MDTKGKILWGLVILVILGVGFWLTRFVFFDIHGMKDWPGALAVFGAAAIVLSLLLGSRITGLATVLGYLGGFALAMLFGTEGVDPGGGSTNNAWKIWTVVLVLSIPVGALVDFLLSKKMKKTAG